VPRFGSVCVALLLVACARGALSSQPDFDDARTLFPENYRACDEGAPAACSALAFQWAQWRTDGRLPETLALHRMACTGGTSASCVELALLEVRTDAAARTRLQAYCSRERLGRACEVLAREAGDEDAAKVGCELKTERMCWTLNELWKKGQRVEAARSFFGSQCSQSTGEACLMAATWVRGVQPAATAALANGRPASGAAEAFPTDMVWYHRACEAGSPAGCQSLAAAFVARAVNTGARQECQLFGSSLRKACQTPESCRGHLYCQAAAGDATARTQLDHCRREIGGVECALFLQLPGSARERKPKRR
jgi:hypothetical protein